jgi:hypothetical protein
MNKNLMSEIKDWFKYIGAMLLFMGVIWSAAYFFADAVKNYEVIDVSRMMMTSVSCWKVEQ